MTESPPRPIPADPYANQQALFPPPSYGQGSPSPYPDLASSPYPAQSGSPYAQQTPSYVPPVQRFYYEVQLSPDQLEQCRQAVERVLKRELGPLATKLAVANERLFDQYDRLSAEASLRLNACLPLAVLFGVLALRLSWLFLLGIPAAVLLAWQGLLRMRSANDLLMQSVITKTVESSEVAGIVRYVIRDKRGLGD
jgi:hypothetical protein